MEFSDLPVLGVVFDFQPELGADGSLQIRRDFLALESWCAK